MTPAAARVMIVDDEVLIAELFMDMVEDIGLAVCGMAMSADEAIALAEQQRPDLILMDVRLRNGSDGVYAGNCIHVSVGCPVIYITGSREEETLVRIKQGHPAAILIKPVPQKEFETTILRILAERA